MFSIENFKFYFKSWTLERMLRMTKPVSKAGKNDCGDRVTLPGIFACKPELYLTRFSPCKQALRPCSNPGLRLTNMGRHRSHSCRPFSSCLQPLFHNEATCKVSDIKIVFYSYANNAHFHIKYFTLVLILKVMVFQLRNGLLTSWNALAIFTQS